MTLQLATGTTTITLHSTSIKLVRLLVNHYRVRHHIAHVVLDTGPLPDRADAVVTLGSAIRPHQLAATRFGCGVLSLPEGLDWLDRTALFDRRAITLVGTDRLNERRTR